MIALVLAFVFAILGLLHVYWAFGGPTGKTAVAIPEVNGRPAFVPSRLATLAVATLLFTAGLLVMMRGGWLGSPVPPALIRIGTEVLGAVFVLRAIGDFRLMGFFKSIRGTAFARWDTALFSPLCLTIGLAAFWLTL